ncbi:MULTISPECIES: hypothetical protein [Flavobacteriaceae]|uniref:hypothetical protein n=1 Tax=Flavobacteriaceae TaxID=49546 RepID=UPI0014912952|nr:MULTISPECIES: hypothetical protein [Allomuricauda]MDC6367228.1 hypothetical protein [Muricauda sp. AC10]
MDNPQQPIISYKDDKEVHTYKGRWNGIAITVVYQPNYFESANVSHLEVRADEPLPITETGYRSHWVLDGELEGTDPFEYTLKGLDVQSKSKQWKCYLEHEKTMEIKKLQLSLF